MRGGSSDNIEEWADGMYKTEKELLLQAVVRRSHFTFDIIHWIKNRRPALCEGVLKLSSFKPDNVQ